MNPRYTIIIPHHNQPLLLERLLKSLPKRNDLQVLVIEDNEGRGAGWARNKGLTQATGDYIIFVDSDDTLITNNFNYLLDKYEKDDTSDVIFFNATSIDDTTHDESYRADRLNWIMQQPSDKKEFYLRYLHSEPWCRMVKRSLIERYNVQFDKTKIVEDVVFCYLTGYYAGKVVADDTVCYCIHDNQGSVGKRHDVQSKCQYTHVMANANIFFREHNIDLRYPQMYRHLFLSIVSAHWHIASLCYNELLSLGISRLTIIYHMLRYPYDLVQWYITRRKYRKARISYKTI